MSLRSRIEALERAAEGARFPEACETCGFPDQSAGLLVLLDGADPDRCERCGRVVGRDGRGLGPRYAHAVLTSDEEKLSLPHLAELFDPVILIER